VTRAALVTGAGQNIGRAVALALAADGFDIVVNGQSNRAACDETAEMVTGAGRQALVAMGDVGEAGACRRIADEGIARFGRIDVLVANAAIRPASPFLEMDEAEWQRVIAVNLTASFRLARACLPGMLAAGWGRIVLFAGMNAIHGYSGRAHVSVSKHGNWGLTKALAKEFGPKGITANIVSPGPIASEHADRAMTEHIKAQAGRIPVGRLGTPEEVAAVVCLLASERGAFINGQLIQVNGGAET
jgi:3-oxoacyl-[acyl-carrier protein] reductase